MNNVERDKASERARHAPAFTKVAADLKVILFTSGVPLVQGVLLRESEVHGTLFEYEAHGILVAARFSQVIRGADLAGRLNFCRLKLDGSIGDVILQAEVEANGDITFPDKESVDVWPQNNPDANTIVRVVSFQLLKAVQDNLPRVD
jgi:hypothetical protein